MIEREALLNPAFDLVDRWVRDRLVPEVAIPEERNKRIVGEHEAGKRGAGLLEPVDAGRLYPVASMSSR